MRRIGLDFDNTIICYDEVFLAAAIERGLAPRDFTGAKQQVRDAIRLLPEGELAWQKLQGFVYGAGIGGARAFEGLADFIRRAKAEGNSISIVSHKTEYGHFDPQRVNLRQAARGWMEARGFFDPAGLGLSRADVHFAATRAEKLRQIAAARCDVFVDDLEEVLSDPDFPDGVERILFSDQPAPVHARYRVCATWRAVEEALFA